MKLVTAAEMRELDRKAIEEVGIPSLVLMENAGRTTYQILRQEFPALVGPVAVVAGRGNNGGDGSVVARYLAQAGIPVAIFLVAARDQVQGDALVNLEIAARQGVEIVEVKEEKDLNPLAHRLARSGLIVDALLGTGLNSEVRGLMRLVIDEINRLRPPVLAVDIPSGLSADTGQPLGAAVQAQVTVTYGWPKIGQILPPGRDYVGRLWQVDISIPPELAKEVPGELADDAEMRALLPPRPLTCHKGTFGHLVVLAGSAGKTGAAALTSEGALRAGAGLVTLGIAASLNDILEVKITEAMTLPLPEAIGERALGMKALEPLQNFLEQKTALALGPGLGTHPETQELVRRLARDVPLPLVIDADGVNALAGEHELLKEAAGPRILTPHPGEMARFL
ncbi:MAG: NAD(P)H-hydrate epimerase, partial [Deltaproteobacteria bacterium]|nr:NAD(P)H-hydrate epimerase [Deltaproteobacteria bacterium]